MGEEASRKLRYNFVVECTSDWTFININDIKISEDDIEIIYESGNCDFNISDDGRIRIIYDKPLIVGIPIIKFPNYKVEFSFKSEKQILFLEVEKGDMGTITININGQMISHSQNIDDDSLNSKKFRVKSEKPFFKPSYTQPNVLIFLLTKGHGRYLEKHLTNYKNLTYPKDKIRMVIVYGDSRDNTEDLILNFAVTSDFNVELYHEPEFNNQGGISSHYIADLCEGIKTLVDYEEFIIFMDDDVVSFPSNLITEMVNANEDIVAPYPYIDGSKEEFWDTFVFRDLNGNNFDRKNPYKKDSLTPVQIGSAGTCLGYQRKVFLNVPFMNPAPHLKFCEKARKLGYKIWGLPYLKLYHADVRNERKDWNENFGGHNRMKEIFQAKEKKEKIVKRKLISRELICSYCGSKNVTLERDEVYVYCSGCRSFYPRNRVRERIIEEVTTEWKMEKQTYKPINREDFKTVGNIDCIDIFAHSRGGYGGLSSIPFYLRDAIFDGGKKCRIFPLEFRMDEETIKRMVSKASDKIIYYHYDKLASIVEPLLTEANKLGKKVIVFPSDSWMDMDRNIRKLIYTKSWKILAYADWIKERGWSGECKGFGENPNKIEVIRFGVKIGRKINEDEIKAIREELGIKTKYLIGEMGFVREGKGFIYPMLQVVKNLKDITFLIVGSGDQMNPQPEYLHNLREEIKDLNISDRVIWIDKYLKENEIDEYLGACDLLVVPTISSTDTSGTLNLSLGIDGGKCVVATPQRTRREIAEKYGALVISSVEDFEKNIKFALSQTSNIQKKTKKYVDSNSWNEFAKKLWKMFNSEILEYKEDNKLPKVMIVTAIKFDTEWQKKSLIRNLEHIKALDYPKNKLKLVYMCASRKEVAFVREQFSGEYDVDCLIDSKSHRENLGKYSKYSVHFYGPLFNRMKQKISDKIDYVWLIDADYVDIPPDTLKNLLSYNVDIISAYQYSENGGFFDVYGFANFGEDIHKVEAYRPFTYNNPYYKREEGIVPLPYAGTGVQLIDAQILKEIEWINPDSWLHWCWMARKKGYIVWAAPQVKVYHGAGYIEDGKESTTFYDLVYSKRVDVNECVNMGLFNMSDWRRYLKIKWSVLSEDMRKKLWIIVQQWINNGKMEDETIWGNEKKESMI